MRKLLTILALLLAGACSDEEAPRATREGPDEAALQITVYPRAATVAPNEVVQFRVTGVPLPEEVQWGVRETGGGTISAGGRYAAPASAGVFTVTARYAEAETTATVDVVLPEEEAVDPAVRIEPGFAVVIAGAQQTFALETALTLTATQWRVREGAAGGTVSGGVYTAPSAPGVYHIDVEANDGAVTASATVVVRENPACVKTACPAGTVASTAGCDSAAAQTFPVALRIYDAYDTGTYLSNALVHVVEEGGDQTGVCAVTDGNGNVSIEAPSNMAFGIKVSRSDLPDNYRFYAARSSMLNGILYVVTQTVVDEYTGFAGVTRVPEHGILIGTLYKSDGFIVDYGDPMTVTTLPVAGDIVYSDLWGRPDPDASGVDRSEGRFYGYNVPAGARTLRFFVGGVEKTLASPGFRMVPASVTWEGFTCSDCL